MGFRANHPEALAFFEDCLRPLPTEPDEGPEVEYLYSYRSGGRRGAFRDYHLLYQGARKVARSLDVEQVRAALQHDLWLLTGSASPDSFCLGGGAVEWEGRMLVLLGLAGEGTTTLLRALRNRGARRVADGLLLFDSGTGHLLHDQESPVTAFFHLPYGRGRRTRLERLQAGAAALQLFACSPAAALQPERLFSVFARLAREVPVFRGERGDSRRAAPAVLEAVRQLGPGK